MGPLSLFLTGQGVLLLALLAAIVVLLWDWRVSLGALFVIQVGIAALAVGIEEVPGQMMLVQTMIVFLCCLMLATSGVQVRLQRSSRQSGGWFFRLLVLGLLGAALSSLDLTFVLPQVAPAIARLFGWLGLLALLMLSLGDNPLFTSVALLLWCAVGYAVAAFYAPVPGVLVAIGLVELVVGLTCSYLILAERLPRLHPAAPLPDLDFPETSYLAAPEAVPPARPSARNPFRRVARGGLPPTAPPAPLSSPQQPPASTTRPGSAP